MHWQISQLARANSNRLRSLLRPTTSLIAAMSTKSQSTMDSLPPALKALITSAGISAGYDLQGKIESDQDSVAEWLTKAAQGDVAKEDALKVRCSVLRGLRSEAHLRSRSL